MVIFVEGGGDSKYLKRQCGSAFSVFLSSAAALQGKSQPKIRACGGRQNAFNKFRKAISNGEDALLLVDSEAPVAPECQTGAPQQWRPWQHLKNRQGDGWDKPEGATERQCHLMVQCMESWLVADRDTLQAYYGQEFLPAQLPSEHRDIESVDKKTLARALESATQNCQKGSYKKGRDSFEILRKIRADNLCAASPWAKRFMDELKARLSDHPAP